MFLEKILIVEDDMMDIYIIKKAINAVIPDIPFKVVENGSEAVEWLKAGGRPQLIISDLKMPMMNGLELLEAIKSDAYLKRIPIIIMSTSDADEDIRDCYERNANAYIVKPGDFSGYEQTVDLLKQFWIDRVARAA